MLAGWGRPARQGSRSETGGAAARTKPSSCSAQPLPPPHPHPLDVSPVSTSRGSIARGPAPCSPGSAADGHPRAHQHRRCSARIAALIGIISAAASEKNAFLKCVFKSKHNESVVGFFSLLIAACLGGAFTPGCWPPSLPRSTARALAKRPATFGGSIPKKFPRTKKTRSAKSAPQENGQDASAAPHRNPPRKNKPFGLAAPSPHSRCDLPARRKTRKKIRAGNGTQMSDPGLRTGRYPTCSSFTKPRCATIPGRVS